MKTYVVILLALIIGVSACNKTSKNKVQSIHTVFHIVQMDSVTPSNPRSPYNDVGWLHNRIVHHLGQCYDGQDLEKMLYYLRDFYEEEKGEPLPREQFFKRIESMKPIFSNEDSFLREKIKSIPLWHSYVALKYSVDQLYDNGSSYEEIKKYIMQYEDEVSNSLHFSEEERTLLLKTASLARYSIYYWISYSKARQASSGVLAKWKIFTKAFWIDAGVYLMLGGDTYTAGMYSSSFGANREDVSEANEEIEESEP